MDRRRVAMQAARSWAEQGLLSQEQLAAIEAHEQESPQDEPWSATALFALGGILTAAAVVALVVLLGLDGRDAAVFITIFGAILGVGATAAHVGKAPAGAVDGLVLAALACLSIGGDVGSWPYSAGIPLLAGVAAMVWRADRPVASTGGALTAAVAIPLLLLHDMDPENVSQDTVIMLWFGLTTVFTAATVTLAKKWSRFHEHGPVAVTTVAYGIACIPLVVEVIDPGFLGGESVLLALLFAPAAVLGFLLRAPTMMAIALLGLAVDAIVFAFVVGGKVVGFLTLLLAAGAMVGLAMWARQRV